MKEAIATVDLHGKTAYQAKVTVWHLSPAPRRGEGARGEGGEPAATTHERARSRGHQAGAGGR